MPGLIVNTSVEQLLSDAVLASEDGYDGLLAGAVVELIGAEFEESPDLVLGDLTLSTFTGYSASAAITWQDPYLQSANDSWVLTGDSKQFVCSDDADEPESVYGYAVVRPGSPDVLLAVEAFSVPDVMETDHGITIIPQVAFSNQNMTVASGRVVT